jgi:hypothetical protein
VNFEVGYIFVSSLIASLVTFLVLSPNYFRVKWSFDFILWKNDALRINLVAGIALQSMNILIKFY